MRTVLGLKPVFLPALHLGYFLRLGGHDVLSQRDQFWALRFLRTWQHDLYLEKGHGRLQRREIWTSPDLNDWFVKEWCEVAQVFRLERTVQTLKTGEIHHEVVYGLYATFGSLVPLQKEPKPRSF